MLFPIGLEDSRVDRLPWACIAIAALVGLVFLFTWVVGGGPEALAALESPIRFWAQHPHLAIPEDLASQLDPEAVEALRRRVAAMPAADTPGLQAELDRLAAEAVATFQSSAWYRFGLVPAKGFLQPGWITHMFLHVGWEHVLGNLFFFYMAAPFLEDRWGRPVFLTLFLFGGVLAALFHVMEGGSQDRFLVGASGAVAACMGAFALRVGGARMRVLIWLIRPKIFSMPAWGWVALWFAGQVANHLLFGNTSQVAFMAHIAGAVAGFVLALIIQAFGIEERWIAPDLDHLDRIGPDGRRPPAWRANLAGLPVAAGLAALSAVVVGVAAASARSHVAPSGTVLVDSTPPGAAIWLNGEDTGFVTPHELTDLRVDRRWRVSVALAGFRASPAEREVRLAGDLDYGAVDFRLEALRAASLTTDPPGARVYRADVLLGTTPLTLPPTPLAEAVTLELRKEGFLDGKITLPANDDRPAFDARLTAGRTVRVDSEPPGATVIVDGQEVGTTPLSVPLAVDARPRVRITAPTYRPWARRVRVARLEGGLRADLVPLPFARLPLTPEERSRQRDVTAEIARAARRLRAAEATHRRASAQHARAMNDPRVFYDARIAAENALADAEYALDDARYAHESAQAAKETFREQVRARLRRE